MRSVKAVNFPRMKAVNLPLLVLFGLSYGLGHPSLASYRPQLVDKTLASFHQDVNRTAIGASASLTKLFDAEKAEASATTASAVAKVAPALPVIAAPVVESPKPNVRLAEVSRRSGNGFQVLNQ